MTETQKTKKAIILNYVASLMQQEPTYNWLTAEIDSYVTKSPDEIKAYINQTELDRIKYSER